MKRIEFHDAEPALINLSPKGLLAPNIVEFKIRCTNETKVSKQSEVYLFISAINGLGNLSLLLFASLSGQIDNFREFN